MIGLLHAATGAKNCTAIYCKTVSLKKIINSLTLPSSYIHLCRNQADLCGDHHIPKSDLPLLNYTTFS